MRQRLQFVAECNRADTVFTERWQPTVDSLADYFRSHGTRNERMTALYLKGRVHHDLGEAPQALDATVCAEQPKLNPHIPKMQACMAEVMGVSPSQISIKATTTERLGFTGREEGISAYAVALIRQ